MNFAFANKANTATKELLLLIKIWRHGARCPRYTTGDKALGTSWDLAQGQLTELGRKQTYEIGKEFRRTYNDFLPNIYNPKQFLVISSELDRTIMSAYYQLKGIFENTNSTESSFDKENPLVPTVHYLSDFSKEYWIYVIDTNHDKLIRVVNSKALPENKILIDQSFQKANKKIEDKFEPLYHELVTKFGADPDLMWLRRASDYIDTWEMAKTHDKKMSNELSKEAAMLVSEYFQIYFYEGYFGDPKVVKSSTLMFYEWLWSILEGKKKAIENQTEDSNFLKDLKFIFLSAHNTTIAAYLSALGHIPNHFPDLWDSIVIEFYKMNGKFYVRWEYDEKYLFVGSEYTSNGDCELESTLDFIKNKIY